MQGIFRFLCADAGVFADLDDLPCSGLVVASRKRYRHFMLQRLSFSRKSWHDGKRAGVLGARVGRSHFPLRTDAN